MKTTILIVLATFVFTNTLQAQPFNFEVNPESKSPSLSGKINKEGLSGPHYTDWFTKNYEEYAPKQSIINQLQNELDHYTITAFMGTWCGDSKREVPRFYKVLDAANFPLERLTLVAVHREKEMYKRSPGGEEEGMNIHRVPTFIIYKNGKEVNRIVESPVASLEEDLANILQNNYTPNYHGVTLMDNLLTEIDTRSFNKKQKRILHELKTHVKGSKELNTYAYVMSYSGKESEAVIAARMNTLLFPEEARTYVTLASFLDKTNNSAEALENYQKALELDPENEKAKTGIKALSSSTSN